VEPDITLGPDDRVSVQGDGGFTAKPPSVLVKGQVQTQGAYALVAGPGAAEDSLWDVLERAGGLMPDADPDGIVIYRGLTETVGLRHELDQVLGNYNREAEAVRAQLSDISVAAQGAASDQVAQQMAQVLSGDGTISLVIPPRHLTVDRSVQTIAVDGAALMGTRGKQANVRLEAGDVVSVPRQRDTVAVIGAVLRPGAVPFQPNLTMRDYITQSGGLAADAALDKALVLAPNGRVEPNPGGHRLQPGEVIVVPSDYLVKTRSTESGWMRAVRALSTAAVLALGL